MSFGLRSVVGNLPPHCGKWRAGEARAACQPEAYFVYVECFRSLSRSMASNVPQCRDQHHRPPGVTSL